eukprot:TCONS_00049348-protein
MNYDIGNIVHFSNSDGIATPLTLFFNVTIDDKFIGSCQFTIENVSLKVELGDNHGNNFLFKPNKIEEGLENKREESSPDINKNRLGLGEEVTIKMENDMKIKVEPEENLDEEQTDTQAAENRLDNSGKAIEQGSEMLEEDKVENPSNCHASGKAFSQYNQLGYIRSLDNINKLNEYEVPGERFTGQQNKNTPTVKKPFTCEICGNGFSRKDTLKIHTRLHTGQVSFKCEVCGKEYTRKDKLKIHLLSHSDEKPFNCGVCGKGFARKDNLTDHLRSHTGEKPFPCKVCGKSFSQKGGLLIHTRIHTGFAPFKCHLCEKRFTRNDQLRNHLLTHSDKKPFSCEVCEKGFNTKSNMLVHMRIHDDKKPIKSDEGGKEFAQNDNAD